MQAGVICGLAAGAGDLPDFFRAVELHAEFRPESPAAGEFADGMQVEAGTSVAVVADALGRTDCGADAAQFSYADERRGDAHAPVRQRRAGRSIRT